MLAGILSAGALIGVPAIAQDSSSSPQAPAPTYPETNSDPATTPQDPAVSEPETEPAPGALTPEVTPEIEPAPGAAPGVLTPEVTPETETSEPAAETETSEPAETEVPGTPAEAGSMTITEMVAGGGSFTTLNQALQAADLTETLSEEGPYTVFAPTDAAFAELPEGALEFLLQPENKALLQEVLTYHVASETLPSSEISTGLVETMGGGLAARVSDDGVVINNASVIQPDVEASNGVIHVINRVLLPETVQQALASELGLESIY